MNAPVPPAGWARPQLSWLVLLIATALGIILCYRLALPFLPALTWALALAVLFAPLQRWLESKLRGPSLAAFLCVVVIGVIVVVPVTFLAERLIDQATKGAELVQRQVSSGEWRRALQSQPQLASFAARIERHFDLPGAVKTSVAWLSASAGSFVRGSVTQLVGFVLTFYLLFFFLRDHAAALTALRRLSPLSPREMDRLFERVGDTIHATIYGSLAVSALQGFLGGLMFWWLDLPAPFLWGVVMALLAVVPMLGAIIVWAPAALFLALDGHLGRALLLTLWGALVVGTIDNLLRPLLVGNRLKLHTVLAFISVVGGIIVFGAAGLILGPVVLTITSVLLDQWSGRHVLALPPPAPPPAP